MHDCTFVLLGCSENLLQSFVQSSEKDPGQVVGSVSLLSHDQGQLRGQEGDSQTGVMVSLSQSYLLKLSPLIL